MEYSIRRSDDVFSNIKERLSSYCNHPFFAGLEGGDASTPLQKEFAFAKTALSRRRLIPDRIIVEQSQLTTARLKEFNRVWRSLMDLFPDAETMEDFCSTRAEDLRNGHDYNMFLDGNQCQYWIRCNKVANKGNLYIHAVVK